MKPALAAAVVLIVVGGIGIWPSQPSDAGKWWLGPSAVWGQEILAALDSIKIVTCRERTEYVYADGSEHLSGTWDLFYMSRDSYRRDIYDDDVLREIQWYLPDPNGTLFHDVRYDKRCYFSSVGDGSFGDRDPVERLRFYVRYLDEARSQLGEREIEGRLCVGFEISASQYGDNPEHWVDRIWFDADTKHPVLIEQRGRQVTDEPDMSYTKIQDRFEYHLELPEDTFIPLIPEGFIHAHPDDVE